MGRAKGPKRVDRRGRLIERIRHQLHDQENSEREKADATQFTKCQSDVLPLLSFGSGKKWERYRKEGARFIGGKGPFHSQNH